MSAGGDGVGLIYGLEYQCRALAPVEYESEKVRFMVGTQGLKMENQIHELELEEDSRRVINKTHVFLHSVGEIWELATAPTLQDTFYTRYTSLAPDGTQKMLATVWKSNGSKDLDTVCHLDVATNDEIAKVSWMPVSGTSGTQIMVLAGNQLSLHDIAAVTDGKAKLISSGRLEGKGYIRFNGGAWNPHQNCQQYATLNEHHVRGWDVRTMAQSWTIQECFSTTLRSIDFNPNKQYQLATAGDDGAVRFWDIRQTKQPVAARTNDHSHWIWSVKYNAFHDQLLLTSSSDGHVVLSCMTSISSEPYGHIVDDEEEVVNEKPVEDGVIRVYDDHEDSVYVAEWSTADPWTFASLSYDGRLVINQVPRSVKFRILNLV